MNDKVFPDGVIAFVDKLTPIPITAEILEKIGFECDKEEPEEAFYGDSSNIFHTKGTLHYVLVTDEVAVVCFFIHQLQHALRLAGVDKEINL